MPKRKRNEVAGTSLWMVIIYLVSSFFSALIFSILFRRARRQGRGGVGWLLLALLAAGVFGTISYSLVFTSGPGHDAGWYYLGYSTLVANGVALLILFLSFFIKPR
jgi:hypothetical protein